MDQTTLWMTSQNPHIHRLLAAAFVLGMPEHKLRVIAPDVGGGFGSKLQIYAEEVPAVYTVSKKGFVAIRNRVKNARPSIFRPWAVWNAKELYIDPKAAGAKETASR